MKILFSYCNEKKYERNSITNLGSHVFAMFYVCC